MFAAALWAVVVSACGRPDTGSAGAGTGIDAGLVVAIDTDLSLPKDLDAVHLEVLDGTTMLFEHDAQALPLKIEVPEVKGGSELLLRAVGLKDGNARVEHSALVTVPNQYVGFVRLTLNYLCIGMVVDAESSCGLAHTCNQGACEPAAIAYELPQAKQADLVKSASTDCFDVAHCLSMATEVSPDPDQRCSFTVSEALESDLNVALRLEPGSEGACTKSACWVVLDADGFSIGLGQRVFVPESICMRRQGGADLRVAVSAQCPTKPRGTPLCPSEGTPGGNSPKSPISVGQNRSLMGDACMGGATRACGMCGTQARTCQGGLWSEFGTCTNEGACAPEASEACGANGLRTCGGDCTWSECENQSCDGPHTRSCGDCGTQRRTCREGEWSEWSACVDEGACMPGATRACGEHAVQACQGSCEWRSCEVQVCDGASTRACGDCGTQTRICESASGEWSDWGACEDEGECRPDSSRPCGRNGTQTCGGDCRWDDGCPAQTCEGPARRACGRCGTQTRTCDTSTGEYSEWSACGDQGECMPDEISECGSAGARTCGGDCRWDSVCTGQVCEGSSMRACGDCGTQARACDANTAEWSEWGTCSDQGECSPGEIRSCGSNGMQSCSGTCRWAEACEGQACSGPNEQPCPNSPCVLQTRTCDERRGEWSAWTPECPADGCRPGDTDIDGCMPHAQRSCDESTCTWGSTCRCAAPYVWCPDNSCQDIANDPEHCGRCGRRCAEGQACVAGGCQCAAHETRCEDGTVCVDTQNARRHCGGCDIVCADGESCIEGHCQADCSAGQCACPAGEHRCNDEGCQPRSRLSCGPNCWACPDVEGAEATCSDDDVCAYRCLSGGPLCASACCAAGQTCENDTCETPSSP